MSATQVECQCPETLAYYPAFVKDYKAGSVLVSYPNNWKNDEWVKTSVIRRAPAPFDLNLFNPTVGSVVEAMAQSGEHEPFGWWEVRIKSERGPYYIVNFTSFEEYSEVMEKEKLRPKNSNPALTPSDFMAEEIAIPRDIASTTRPELLAHLLEPTGALSLSMDEKRHVLIVRGSQESIKKFKAVAHMAFRHLAEVARLESKIGKVVEHKQKLESTMSNAKFVEFDIPYELIGLAIGKKGANIQKATKLKGVIAVNVSKEGHVTIRAETEEACAAVRKMMEFVEERIPVPTSLIGRIIGKQYAKLAEITEAAGVARIRVDAKKGGAGGAGAAGAGKGGAGRWSDSADDDDTTDLVVCGTLETVGVAKQMIIQNVTYTRKVAELTAREDAELKRLREFALTSGAGGAAAGYGGAGQGGRRGGGQGGGERGKRSQRGERKQKATSEEGQSQGGSSEPQGAGASGPGVGGRKKKQGERKQGGGGGGGGEQKQQQTGGEKPKREPKPKREQKPKGEAKAEGGAEKPKREPKPKREQKPKGEAKDAPAGTEAGAAAGGEAKPKREPKPKREQKPKGESKQNGAGAAEGAAGAGAGAASESKPKRENQGRRDRNKGKAEGGKPKAEAGAAAPAAAAVDAAPAAGAAATGSS